MGRIIFVGVLLLIFILLDVYAYNGMSGVWSAARQQRLYRYSYLVISAAGYISLLILTYMFATGQTAQRSEMMNVMNGFVFALFVSKLLFCVFLGLQDIIRLFVGGVHYLSSLIVDGPEKQVFIPERRKFITTAGTFVAAVPFLTMLYGITRGKYKYTVEEVELFSDDIPPSFDGFTIVQISDIHAGSFDNKEKVLAGIEKINLLKPDMVCFTGDLVNSEKEEILPYIDVFGKIEARHGKFAVLGNHDYYGTYDRNSQAAERRYFDDFFTSYNKMGFRLLNNENISIEKGGETIRLIGVENWGAGRWFPKKGDLDEALKGVEKDAFSILLSHDPTHWDQKVRQHAQHIHLTLSGHTHGFQFGFQMPGFKWSPAQYRYKHWAGLYEQDNRYLYVNRGFGFLGFPGRVGMWPEITRIILRRGQPGLI